MHGTESTGFAGNAGNAGNTGVAGDVWHGGNSAKSHLRARSIAPAPTPTITVARMTACGFAIGVSVIAGFDECANASIITNWNMNAVDPTSSPMAYASTGIGVANLSAFGSNAGTLLGTTLGGVEGEIAGNALAITGSAANGQAMTFDFDATDYTNLSLSFAVRRSSTGFANNRVDWWDGLAWTTVARFGASTTAWEVQSFDFATYDAMDGRSAYFRIVIDGATSSSGSIRFDNIRFAGTPVPAPGALALLGLAGCFARTTQTKCSSRRR